MLTRVCCSIVVVIISAELLCGSEFIQIGKIDVPRNPAAKDSRMTGLSDDGRVVLGHMFFVEDGRDWLWSQDSGFTALPVNTFGSALSGDGSTVGGGKAVPGGSLFPQGRTLPFIWRANSGSQIVIPVSTQYQWGSFADLSDNGLVGVGVVHDPDPEWRDGEAFIWSEDQGLRVLECPHTRTGCWATNISGDGRVVLGRSDSGHWRWTEADGMVDLGDFAPTDLSHDGTVMVGKWQPDGQAVLWTPDGGFQVLDDFGANDVRLYGQPNLSGDGPVVFGWSEGNGAVVVWDEYHGTRDLASVLRGEYGFSDLPLDTWIVWVPEYFSADRKTTAGNGNDNREVRQTWLIRFDTPLGPPPAGDANDDGVIDVADLDLFAAAIRAGRTESYWDVDGSGVLDQADRSYVVHDILQTWMGDVDLDGQFGSQDLVQVFLAGQYEDTIAGNSTWATGDWSGDGEFTSSDMVLAFLDGGYEQGPRPNPAAVPEPSNLSWMLLGLLLLRRRARRSQQTPCATRFADFVFP